MVLHGSIAYNGEAAEAHVVHLFLFFCLPSNKLATKTITYAKHVKRMRTAQQKTLQKSTVLK